MDSETQFHKAIKSLTAPVALALVAKSKIGIEKESLRVQKGGELSPNSHPPTLGSALTHPYITTDYAEMLMELVVPPCASSQQALDFMTDLHSFVHQNLDAGELLWANSLPCPCSDETHIPLAQYGTSNLGRMKTIYRAGLGYRYGRSMQTIAGIHFNYSFSNKLWAYLAGQKGLFGAHEQDTLRVRNDLLMGVIRNLMRMSWVIPYLFGASPAVCKSFPHTTSKNNGLQVHNTHTLFGRYATSLRMGDLGYQNNLEAKRSFTPIYNSLPEYIASLHTAVTTQCPEYEKIGVYVDGEHRQLNACILQIENEHYASVRPKCTQHKNEMRLLALNRQGIEYIELRSLDLNAFNPIGLELKQMHFLEMFLWWALLRPSPALDKREQMRIHNNEVAVAHRGRDPRLQLMRKSDTIGVSQWGLELCTELQAVAALLDTAHQTQRYREALVCQQELFVHPEKTLSAKILNAMQQSRQEIAELTLEQSKFFHQYFLQHPLSATLQTEWQQLAQQSLQEQAEAEAQETLPLKDFMRLYFDQLNAL